MCTDRYTPTHSLSKDKEIGVGIGGSAAKYTSPFGDDHCSSAKSLRASARRRQRTPASTRTTSGSTKVTDISSTNGGANGADARGYSGHAPRTITSATSFQQMFFSLPNTPDTEGQVPEGPKRTQRRGRARLAGHPIDPLAPNSANGTHKTVITQPHPHPPQVLQLIPGIGTESYI